MSSKIRYSILKLEVLSLKYIKTKIETITVKKFKIFVVVVVGNAYFSVGTLKRFWKGTEF